ncbi:MAG: bifunctional diguanylate cyclase/phosphodiesterase [Cupriavidus sp.]|jgi:diguanylate cyclase (GGDEF)-like protein|uniref:putative bifunctional diguanylate cyclase/phosphodiesterase n=1 Tax=Cupriavidus pauculus TaxID=82633 RepID=UPI00078447E8|nr:bifunctional diguanylate cyclase/phosphodiesterase [Cupriavidus pauculus]MBU69651.1 bifunctional diguanylate cyclase/phosphodiesterase [Cupriavidus sp.]KAB0603612.1 bifunctional diguanylate cyclase/phosphodiesterase [Cupriavidus pauculus]MBY4732076.1 bifunctional diguanylate cyclase/phosphodiesterase [Cupriavidus pauculus]MCM3605864.1 bifunctional diguanylate cyclase/phosphodiesterase [Cupriavidus pauculus]UAL03668.1 bifunctional diguanylate cyclase/phosphodiesterase [Cupriavidus pauculus]
MVAKSGTQATGALPSADVDSLTGVVARQAFFKRVEARLQSEAKPRFALLLVGIDDFRAFNDMHGHLQGDAILQHVARRLRDASPRDAVVGRVGSDEFGILLTSISDPTLVRHVSAAILSMLSAPYELDGNRHHVLASLGACVMPAGGDTASDVLAAASLALARAKHDGGRTIRFFKPQMRADVTTRLSLVQALREAYAQRQFELLYQPQVDLRDGRVVGAEALMRWRHPTLGLLTPAAFIDALAASSVAADVGMWLLHTACAQARAWSLTFPDAPRVAINLFAAQLAESRLLTEVRHVLRALELPANLLEIEITETIALQQGDEVSDQLQALRRDGVTLTCDDFGTGYASLSFLKSFPVDRLKIDQSFIRNVTEDSVDAAIVRSVINVGQTLKIGVVAEGVETTAQRDFLLRNGCIEAQGYLYGRPMPADRLTDFLRNQPR